jgi:crotonobetainyl-CoA:carnitine CoA-transferase CaiB-like acyl-CoA transferase
VSPLAGLLVVALEQAISAPLCTRHLADLGARVIKVENPVGGDSTRHYDDVVHGMSGHFVWLNHGKESVALDLTQAADRELFECLLDAADVFVSNLAPGALGRLGLGPTDLVRRRPRLVVVDISGYGEGGPLDHKRAYDLLVQAEAGVCAITGEPGVPAKPGVPVADVGTALYAFGSIVTALYDRERTGRGTVVSLAMLDVVAEMMGFALNQVVHGAPAPGAAGMGSPLIAPYGAYPTRDGHTVVLGTTSDREFRRLADMLGRPDLAEDERYRHNADRIRHRSQLDAVLDDWCRTRDLAEIQTMADAAGIGNARLNDVTDLAAHPQLHERGRWHEVTTPGGTAPVLRPPPTSADWVVRSARVPDLGEHTRAVQEEFGARPGTVPPGPPPRPRV